MKRSISTLLTLTLSLSLLQVSAQKTCGTDESNKELRASMGMSEDAIARFDAGFREYLSNYDLKQARVNGNRSKASAPQYIIPVVVHVLHNYGNENITNAQIQSEIDFLNKSFKRLNSDTTNTRPIFKDIAGVANVEFRLARRDPKGNPCNGIVRYYTPLTDRGDDNLKTRSVWDSKRYFNIWTVQKIARDAAAGIVAGYAQFPFFAGTDNSASTDGIMVNCLYFGQTGYVAPPEAVFSVTTTHETGHWLGLYHPFQGDSCELKNDEISETPPRDYDPALGNPNFCGSPNKDSNTCTSDNPDLPDMYENYMDYFTGSCSNNMFTSEQVARMHYTLNNYRPELVSATNLEKTGVDDATFNAPNPTIPVAKFDMWPNAGVNTVRACVGKSVDFRDNSYNSTISAWAWEFGDGATPATSTVQNPTGVVYGTPGWKTVKLTVTGPDGSSSVVRENYVYVEGTGDSHAGSVHTADWEYLNDFIQQGWYFEDETEGQHWQRVTDVKYDGIASLKLSAFYVPQANIVPPVRKFNYSLVSPAFDFTGAGNPYLMFNYSFAPNLTSLKINNNNVTGDSQDGLTVYVSTDCGKSWLQRYKVGGNPVNPSSQINPMSTLPSVSGTSGVPSNVNFTPSSQAHWKNITVNGSSNIPAQNQVRFKITFNAQGGNNFYLDNLTIGMNTGLNDISEKVLQFNAFPNPFNSETTLSYFLPSKANVELSLYDVVGKKVGTVFSGSQDMGQQKVALSKERFNLTNGVYFVRLTLADGASYAYKLVLN